MADRNAEAEFFVCSLVQRLEDFRKQHQQDSTPKKSIKTSSTVIPFFDIEFKNILGHMSKSSEEMEDVRDSNITLATIDQHMAMFRKMFGIKNDILSFSEIRNQSTHDLGRLG